MRGRGLCACWTMALAAWALPGDCAATVGASRGPSRPDPAATAPVADRYDVVLEQFGDDKRIEVIRGIRRFTGLGLAEAVKLLKQLPATVLTGTSQEAAEQLKHDLEAIESKVRPVKVTIQESQMPPVGAAS
jgi:large subunit ribosomal protein L7/L12